MSEIEATAAEEALSAAIDRLDFELSCVSPAIEVLELCPQPFYMAAAIANLKNLRNWLEWRQKLMRQEQCR